MIKGVADGDTSGIRFIGLQSVFELEKAPYSLCHLRLTRSTESDDGLLYAKRSIFENGQRLPRSSRDGSSPRRSEQKSRLGVLHIYPTLQGDVIDWMGIQERANRSPDLAETVWHGQTPLEFDGLAVEQLHRLIGLEFKDR